MRSSVAALASPLQRRAPPLRNQKFADSPLEGDGFELLVPPTAEAGGLRQRDNAADRHQEGQVPREPLYTGTPEIGPG
jgi:hypothetical protein